jgi:catechol 2,3-dioxygenase-like lactoylglutathione lyase family enzyme
MIHHVSLGTNDIERARSFYDPLMKLIGLRLLKASARAAHYGASDIVFSLETPIDGKRLPQATACTSPSRRRTGRPFGAFMPLRSGMAVSMTEVRALAITIMRTTTQPLSGTRMETRLKP